MYVCMYPPLLPSLTSATTNTRKSGLMKRKWEAVKKDREWGEEGSHLVSPRPPSVHYSVVGEKRRPSSRVPFSMVVSTVVGLGSMCARGLLAVVDLARLRPQPPLQFQDLFVDTDVGNLLCPTDLRTAGNAGLAPLPKSPPEVESRTESTTGRYDTCSPAGPPISSGRI